MARYINNIHKAAATLSLCIVITFFYISAPQNVYQPWYEKHFSRYNEYLHLPNLKNKNIDDVDKNIVTNNTTEAWPVTFQNTTVKQNQIIVVDYKFNNLTNDKIKNNSDVLELEFNSRKELMQKACADLGEQADQMNIDWDNGKKVRFIYLDKMKNARVCMHFKSGYSSWTTTARTLKKQKRKGSSKALLITVRHPMVRLLSAWKDKFLGGSPLSEFDEAWRQKTKSKETWFKRWQRYWMLALVSTGKIETPQSLKEAIKKRKKIRSTVKNITLPEGSEVELPDMVDMNDFRNISFTFEDFLRHVIWSYDNGVPNIHWTPAIVQCDVCNLKYDYILHLENSNQEVPYVLNNLGFDIKEFAKVHQSNKSLENKSVPKTKQKTYVDYFNEVSKDVGDRILRLYDADFNLFGYQKEFT